jgi:hypothetical protein
MPIHKRAPVSSFSIESPDLESFGIELTIEESSSSAWIGQVIGGEIIGSFDVADTPGGWHLVWLDKAMEFGGVQTAHVVIAARWVARQLAVGAAVPVHIRLVPDVTLLDGEVIDIDSLPIVGRGSAKMLEPEAEDENPS